MKKLLLIIFLGYFFNVTGQTNGSFVLDWSDKMDYSSESIKRKIPHFQLQNFYFDDVVGAVYLKFNIAVSFEADANVTLSNIIYETVTVSQLGDLSVQSLPSSLNAKVINSKSRNELSAVVTLSPIIRDESGIKRLKSFTYTLLPKISRALDTNFRSKSARGATTIYNSVLSSGDWYTFYVEKSGVYKLSKSFLQNLGLNVNVDPRKIKIYGNGGRMLPLINSVDNPYPFDLTENAVFFQGDNDGVFNDQDYILFYAEGVDNWSEENRSHNNLYDTKSHYYVTVDGNFGKRIAPSPVVTGAATVITTFDDYQYHELDLVNVAKLGRKWLGEQFGITNEKSFTFSFPNIVPALPISITVAGVGVGFNNTKFDVIANTTNVGSLTFAALTVNSGIEGSESTLNNTFPASENVAINIVYSNNGVPASRGYLDYIILKAKRNLIGYGKQFRFQHNAAGLISGIGEFQISNAAAITQVWDITDIYNVSSYTNNAQSVFSFKVPLGEVRKYIAVDNQDYFTPKSNSNSRVARQNLKGTILKNAQGQFQDIDYLIITPAFLNGPAERLANFHRNYSNLNVKVVNTEMIYQEFSSGKQDIGAIRNFVKYVYDNASAPDKAVKYLNLFGDASFDFKNRIKDNTNIIPIFHTLSSFSLSSSFISDDFFVLMDDEEGNMDDINARGLDIAVGRMLVSNVRQADEMVNKVIEYHDIKSFGSWRNNFVLISDDVDVNGEQALQSGLDALGDNIFAQKPFINVKKIHSDSYIQETSSGGFRYPKAKEDFIAALNQGGLVFNYFGHGGEDGLAQERIYQKADGQNLTNRYKYPLFVTITCEFTRFDNPLRNTAGEIMYHNPQGGAIGLVTTTRQITIGTGQAINEAFSSNLYGFGTNTLDSVAEALRKSKSNFSYNPLMVFYIGDPALRLAIPKPKIVLTKINDVPITEAVDDLKALSKIKLSGEVRDEAGNILLSNYNGDLSINVFDKSIERQTLGNDGTKNADGDIIILRFNDLGQTIFRGNVSVVNGIFESSFVVPRDIRIPLGNGRVSFYAKKSGALMDQTGFNSDIKVGGINTNAPEDNIGPRVKLYMNTETFISGGITNESPIFLALLEDENGINTARGIGHDIVAILDGDEKNPYILNDYYETEKDTYQKGRLRFPFKGLAVGLHTLTFKAWDVYNNPIVSEIQFVVVGDETITLKNVLNYPNPFVNYTQFWFTHNRPFEPLEVQVQVMTITGKVVWTKNQVVINDGFLSRDITWDGKDDFGDRIGKGVYVYKLTVKSNSTNKKVEKFEKLVIL